MATFIAEFDRKITVNGYTFFNCCYSRTYHNPITGNTVGRSVYLKVPVLLRMFDVVDYIRKRADIKF